MLYDGDELGKIELVFLELLLIISFPFANMITILYSQVKQTRV